MAKKIIARIPKDKVLDIIQSIGPILSGKKLDAWGLRDIFYGSLAEHLFTKISEAYVKKSYGGMDDLGNEWLPLAPITIKKRSTPKVLRRYPLSIQLLILRVSDKLFASLNPGQFDGLRYRPVRNQNFHYARGQLTIGSKLGYASFVHAKRPLYPDDMTEWFDEAIPIAMERVFAKIQELIE